MASEALPPFPKNTIFPPPPNAAAAFSANAAMSPMSRGEND